MKPVKFLLTTTSMIAFLIQCIFITGCHKDISAENIITADSTSLSKADLTSADRRRNKTPVVNTGTNQAFAIPVNSITLDGSGSYDFDGYIRSYSWTMDYGPGGTISSPDSAKTIVTDLTAGEYKFRLTVTDNRGASATDTIHISNGSDGTTPPVNQLPVVNAGSDQTITFPESSVSLSGSAIDAGGTIVSYLWTKTSGTGGTITNPNSASTTVTGLTVGFYVFNLSATDNAGGIGNKTVSVTINAATTPPPAGYKLTFQSGYDALSDITYNSNGQYGLEPVSIHLSTSVYKTGPGSFLSIPNNVSAGTRSEIQYTDAAQNPTEGAIEYDVMYEVIVPDNGHSLQWHPITSGGSASPGLWHIDGKFVMVNWQNQVNTRYPTGVTIQTQHWYHMRAEYNFGSTGYFRLYIDGALVCNWTGQVGDNSGAYLKVGYNGWDTNSSSSRIYYDNLKVWTK